MIKTSLILALVIFCFSNSLSQVSIDTVHITFRKTTSIVFRYPIVNVDRGSADVIAQKVKGSENTLQVKAAKRAFPETNLTVITADGSLHHFYIHYADDPSIQVYSIGVDEIVQFDGKKSALEFEIATDRILNDRSSGSIAKDSMFKVKLALKGIYIHDDVIFYKLQIRNKSNVKYDVQSLRFFIRDKKRMKRTASQEIEAHPVYIRNEVKAIKSNSKVDVVYALQKFTIPDAKTLDIEAFEKNGGRNLKLRMGNQTIVNAEMLPIK